MTRWSAIPTVSPCPCRASVSDISSFRIALPTMGMWLRPLRALPGCAPSLFQQVVAKCVDDTGDISAYKKNRDVLVEGLNRIGYTCVKPQGAFYLFMKALEDDAYAFCERAKKYDLLLVPSDDFGCPGYVRISYCVAEKTIVDSMPAFEKLMEEYRTNAV